MEEHGSRIPSTEWYFEDYVAGSVQEFGAITVEEEEMVAFARRYDPQPFHIDPVAAGKTIYGGLIASGWLTAALTMRLLVEHHVSRVANMGSPGVDEVRWLKPVRAGDTLSVRITLLEAKRSRSKPDRGTIRGFIEVMNQNRDVVMTWRGTAIVGCRNAS
jgi:acyl dehydratase